MKTILYITLQYFTILNLVACGKILHNSDITLPPTVVPSHQEQTVNEDQEPIMLIYNPTVTVVVEVTEEELPRVVVLPSVTPTATPCPTEIPKPSPTVTPEVTHTPHVEHDEEEHDKVPKKEHKERENHERFHKGHHNEHRDRRPSSVGNQCEVVRTVTKCDVQKWKLQKKINDLKHEVELLKIELKNQKTVYTEKTIVVQNEVLKEVVTKNNLGLMLGMGPSSVSGAYSSTPNRIHIEDVVDWGPIVGLQYNRTVTDSGVSLGLFGISNATGGLTLGKSW